MRDRLRAQDPPCLTQLSGGTFGKSCPCRPRVEATRGHGGRLCQKRPETSRADLSGRGLLRRLPDGRTDRAGGGERGERAQGVGGHLGSKQIRLGDLPVDLFAVDRDLPRGLESQPDGAAADLDDVDLDVVADPDRLADAAGECEHEYPSMGVWWPSVALGGRESSYGGEGRCALSGAPIFLSAQWPPDGMGSVGQDHLT